MPKYHKLDEEQQAAALAELQGWSLDEGKFHREFKFRDFSEAFGFMTRVAMEAHLLDHHPEWSNVWSTVVIDLVTHAEGGITDLDVELAGRINKLL